MSAQRIPLTEMDVAYLVGKEGQTRIRLENFSGARLSIDRDAAEVRALLSCQFPFFACVSAMPLCRYSSLRVGRFTTSPLHLFAASPCQGCDNRTGAPYSYAPRVPPPLTLALRSQARPRSESSRRLQSRSRFSSGTAEKLMLISPTWKPETMSPHLMSHRRLLVSSSVQKVCYHP